VDSECLLQDLPGQSDIAESSKMPVQPAQHGTHAPKPAVTQQPCKWKSKFQKPRAAKALPCDAGNVAVAPCNAQDDIVKHPSMFIGNSPSCIKQAAAKQPAETSSASKRSGLCDYLNAYSCVTRHGQMQGLCSADDEILGVLSSFDFHSSQRAEVLTLEIVTTIRQDGMVCP